MILGIGTDLVYIDRIRKIQERKPGLFSKKIFTKTERDYCDKKFDPAISYASRYAAKEALLKALGYGMREGVSWQDIEIVNDDLGKPEVTISKNILAIAEKRFNLSHKLIKIDLSLTNEREYALAFVVISCMNMTTA